MNALMQRLVALLLVASSSAQPAFGACSDIYPDSQVSSRLAAAAYPACTLDRMSADYAGILEEQVRLLGLLRPAFERRLQKDFEKQAQKIRLDEFNAKLNQTSTLAKALATPPPDPEKGGAAKAPGGIQGVHNLLKESRQQSDSLKSRIALSKDGLEGDEPDTYCKLDFYFRLGDGMNSKMRKCVK